MNMKTAYFQDNDGLRPRDIETVLSPGMTDVGLSQFTSSSLNCYSGVMFNAIK